MPGRQSRLTVLDRPPGRDLLIHTVLHHRQSRVHHFRGGSAWGGRQNVFDPDDPEQFSPFADRDMGRTGIGLGRQYAENFRLGIAGSDQRNIGNRMLPRQFKRRIVADVFQKTRHGYTSSTGSPAVIAKALNNRILSAGSNIRSFARMANGHGLGGLTCRTFAMNPPAQCWRWGRARRMAIPGSPVVPMRMLFSAWDHGISIKKAESTSKSAHYSLLD